MRQYLDVMKNILKYGTRKKNRTGVDTISTFGEYYEHDLRKGFPLLTTKEMSWKNIVVETVWFLLGYTNTDFLEKHGVKFWRPWANKNGEVASGYGRHWRNFNGYDQIKYVVETLKTDPDSRRCVVNAWNPSNAYYVGLPPCHVMWILNTQYENDQPFLNLHLTQRSCDYCLGVPYNLAGYSLVLSLISRFTGIPAARFAHSLVDCHIYTKKADGTMEEYDHVPNAKLQIKRVPKKLPTLEIDDRIQTLGDLEQAAKEAKTEELLDLIRLVGYTSPWPALRFKVAV